MAEETRLLILGGTVFLGRAIVEEALSRGYTVTIFNRGRSNPDLFPEVERLVGDRVGGDLEALRGRSWDAVVDTSGYVPRVVRESAALLSDAVQHYTFISSLSVYADFSQPGIAEDFHVGSLADPATEEVTGDTYGPLKALSELQAAREFPGRALILRPGLIVGPYDPTDRFTYWPHRVALGGEILAPGRPERPIQFIDVRDLAEWALDMIARREAGTFNVNGPEFTLTMGELLDACRKVSGSDARFTWVSEEFLLQQGVEPWQSLPLWMPEISTEYAGFFSFDISKALDAGLRFRPMEETIRSTLKWDAARLGDHPWRAGITQEREAELLERWHARSAN